MAECKYRCVIEYDGTAYHGWQRQKNTPRTIQQAIETVLRQILQEKVDLHGASRTDAGVHARGQVAHFTSHTRMKPDRLRWSVNALLPDDIALRTLEEAPADFHARFQALWKRYRYTVLTGPDRDVFMRHRLWHCRQPLDIRKIQSAVRHLVGTYDFRAFQTEAVDGKDTVRTLHEISFVEEGPFLHVDFRGDGFLYNMVRSLMGTLVLVGKGDLEPADVKRILESRDRRKAGQTAPAGGLCLMEIAYQ